MTKKTLISIIIAGTLATLVFLVLWIFNPNYVEFGPMVKLNKSKECTDTTDSSATYLNECSLYARRVSIYRTNPKTLRQALEEVINESLPGENNLDDILAAFPKNADEWECVIEGKYIIDSRLEKTFPKAIYQCWPKL